MDTFLNLGVSVLLEQDPRPTVVFDLSSDDISAVYANPAYEHLRRIPGPLVNRQDAALARWAVSQPVTATTSYGVWKRDWSTFTISGRWRVASCPEHARHDSTLADVDVVLDESPASSLQGIVSTSTSSNTPPLMDWTVHDIQHVSAYIKWFKAFDWSKTALGPISGWDTELRRLLLLIMSMPDPRVLLWGPERVTLYNEACIPLFGSKHPGALGHGPEVSFAEAWSAMEPIVAAAEQGVTTKIENLPLSFIRNNFDEECFFDLVMQPVCGPDGRVIGALDSFSECTSTTVANRRMSTVLRIGESIAAADGMNDVWKKILSVLSDNVQDVAFAMLYSMTNSDAGLDTLSSDAESSDHSLDLTGTECILQGSVGSQLILDQDVDRFHLFRKTEPDPPFAPGLREAWSSRQIVIMRSSDGTMPDFLCQGVSGRAEGLSSSLAAVIPINSLSGPTLIGAVVLGINPRRPLDQAHEAFLRLLSDRLTHQVAITSLPKEQRLIQAASEEAALRYASMSRQLLQRTQEAERREAKFSRLYENAPVGMYLLRVDGSPIYVNEAYSRITGIDRPLELKYDTAVWRDQVHHEDVPIIEEAWTKAAEDKSPFLIEYRLKRPWHSLDNATGTKIEGTTWLRASGFPDVDDEGNLVSIVGWVSDISLQKWSEELQQKRLDEALEAKYQSERFIDTVSHEIRNPLSAILQSADGILTTLTNTRAQNDALGTIQYSPTEIAGVIESAQTIVFCTQHQKRIVDDILTFSKLDGNLIVLAPEAIVPSALLERAMTMFTSELLAADITTIGESGHENALVVCDASRVLQILINLLTNAIKFTRDREVRHIKLSLCSSSEPPTTSLTGVHFIPRRKTRPVNQLGDDWGNGAETYLQFTISDSGKGLTQAEMDQLFHRFAQASPRTYSQYGGSGLGLFISKELCELHGGQIGVSSVFDEGSTFSFYIKAMTYQPNPSGSPDLRRPSLASRMSRQTAIKFSSLTLPDVAGSPIDSIPVPTLGGGDLPSVSSTPPRLAAKDLTVLIVEDNLINQRVMAKQLRLAGCNVSVANHGEEALDYLLRSSFATAQPPTPQPLSVVLMDIEMPVMDGLTAARKIREMQSLGELNAHVPLAAVTANARSTQLHEALDAGMDIVVTKPFRIAEIIPRILALAEGHQTGNEDPVYAFIDADMAE